MTSVLSLSVLAHQIVDFINALAQGCSCLAIGQVQLGVVYIALVSNLVQGLDKKTETAGFTTQ